MAHPLTGRKQSPEHIAKRIAAIVASPIWRQNATNRLREYAKARIGSKYSPERIAICRLRALGNKSRTGQRLSEETKQKISAALKGKRNALGCVRSDAFRLHLSNINKGTTNTPWYIDGKGKERMSERINYHNSVEYRIWRRSVLQRDNRTYVWCGTTSGKMHADHIKEWSKYPECRLDVDNGRTLCKACHDKRHGLTKKSNVGQELPNVVV